MAQAHSALGSEREALSSQFEAMSMEQQQAMLEMQRQQEELGAAQAGAGAAVSTPPNLRSSSSSCSSLSPRSWNSPFPLESSVVCRLVSESVLGRAHAQLTLQQQLEGTREDLRTTQEELEMYRAQVSALPPLAGVIPAVCVAHPRDARRGSIAPGE